MVIHRPNDGSMIGVGVVKMYVMMISSVGVTGAKGALIEHQQTIYGIHANINNHGSRLSIDWCHFQQKERERQRQRQIE